MSSPPYFGQAEQDKFVLNVLQGKRDGYFLEIGSSHPVSINNSYVLETKYGWKGIMVEYDKKLLGLYETHRPGSIHVMQDATTVDYKTLFESSNVPVNLDYLQIDLEAANGSTLRTLQKLDAEIMDKHKFAVVTFEHDVYSTNFQNTRTVSREIFKKRGYTCVFEDISNLGNPFEDWYVHPDLVDMNYVTALVQRNQPHYKSHPITGTTLNWQHIQYV